MRFTTAVVASVFGLAANAQTTESVTSVVSTAVSTEVTSVTSATTTRELTPEESLQAEVLECVEACEDDVDCKATCITVPNPDETAVNATTSCVAECPQGRGTEEDNAAYGDCVQSCISEHYLTTTFTGGQPTGQPTNSRGSSQGGSEVTATPTPSVSTVTSGSSTYETTVTPTTSGGSASETEGSESEPTDAPNAGAMPFSPIGATGLLGLVAAFFAL